jgi:transposase
MKKSKILQEVRKMKFEEVYESRLAGKLTVEEAAQILGVCGRTFRRYVARYEESGLDGLEDARIAQAAHNAAPVDEVMTLTSLYETRYAAYNLAHFYDKYRLDHQGTRSYNWVRTTLQKAGTVSKAKRKGLHRLKRPRKPMVGMMIHQDASTHEWITGQCWDLIVTLDDATNEIYSAFFVEEEGTWSSFQGIEEVIRLKGLPCSFYSDRGSHYWHTKAAGEKVNKAVQTQFARAMNQLGITMIPAYSPQARGRSERMFRTLQGRLPLELKSADIQTREDANLFLREKFISEFNQLFKVKAEDDTSAFVPWIDNRIQLNDILCIQDERTVCNDNTISYNGKRYQIEKNNHRFTYAKTRVKVHEYQDGSLAIFHGPREIARFPSPDIEHKQDLSHISLTHRHGASTPESVNRGICV